MAHNVLKKIRQQVDAANKGNSRPGPDPVVLPVPVSLPLKPGASVGDGQIAIPGSSPKVLADSYLS